MPSTTIYRWKTEKKANSTGGWQCHSKILSYVTLIIFATTLNYVHGEDVCATLDHYHMFSKKPPQQYKYCSNQCCGAIYMRYCCNTPWLLPAVIIVCAITVFVIVGIVIYFICRSKRRTSSTIASSAKVSHRGTATLHEKSETVTYTISYPGSTSRDTERTTLADEQ